VLEDPLALVVCGSSCSAASPGQSIVLIEPICAVGRGHWEQRIDISVDDEIASLAREFNLMSEELQNIYSRLTAEQLEKLKL
jgi:nitrate/nitrite-specific signal transduction histidine kinase